MMNILVAINKQYISKLEVLLESIFTNNPIETNVYLLHSELDNADIMRLQDFCRERVGDLNTPKRLHAISVEGSTFCDVKIDIPGLSIETYYRLLAAEILPHDIDRILYLDADIIVDGSLDEFYNIDFCGNAAAVCADTIANFKEDIRSRIGLSKEGTYFNAGVILLNMTVWREVVTREKVVEILQSGKSFPFHDQDILNLLLDKNLVYVNAFVYNFEVVLARDYSEYYKNIILPLKQKPIIYHYAGDQKAKPWNMGYNCADFNKYYWKYAGTLVSQTEGLLGASGQVEELRRELKYAQARVDKFKCYFDVTNHWLELENNGKRIEDYFHRNNMFHIVIYGWGELGHRLYEALKKSDICIDYTIDSNKKSESDILIKSLSDDILPETDAVVVTPIMDFKNVSDELKQRYSCPIISIEDIINSFEKAIIRSHEKFVSVIVPVYNGIDYIEGIVKALERNHSMDTEIKIELIIVNDKPDDFISLSSISTNVLAVQVINHQENKGIHASRVDGLRAASGRYIVFLDQDDILGDNYLHSQLEQIQEGDAVVCNGYTTDREYRGPIYPHFGQIQFCVDEWSALVCDNRIISPGQVMIKRTAIPECWKHHILKKNGVDDYFLWISMFEKRAKFKINENKIFTHTFCGNNLSNNYDKMKEAMEEFVKVLLNATDIFYSLTLRDFFCKIYSYHIMEIKWGWNLWEEDLEGYEEVHKLVTAMREQINR
ncbi:MAG: glycosyltransferase [Enterocloster bolteae]|uniref:glycosyltransferase n=1 Tax=Enterocloster bolteae TaxID=208479 RepID=UPI003992BB47